MNHKTLSIMLLLLILFCGVIIAAPADTVYRVMVDTTMLKSRIIKYSNSLETIECSFIQRKYLSVLTEPSESLGYFCYKDPTKVRWEYTEPFKYLLIIGDNRVYIKDNNKTKSYSTTSSKAFFTLNSSMGKIIHGSIFDNNTDFSCKYYENDLNYKLILVPRIKDMKSYFNFIVVYFDKKLFSVSRLVLIENKGDKTDIEFINRKINGNISDDKFIIK